MQETQTIEFSVVIPNWNGVDFIERCLSSLMFCARGTKKSYEIIVVDDASTDGSVAIIAEKFPNVNLIENESNVGFAKSCNKGVTNARGKIVVLVNNDLAAKPEFITNLLRHFCDEKNELLFCVTGKTMDWDDANPNHLNMSFAFESGEVRLKYEDSKATAPTMFFQGGACAFRRDVFLELGGFSELFYPGYWEDYDLSYHALKCGYSLLYEPQAVALHFGKSSFMKRYGRDAVAVLVERNKLIFTMLSITDTPYIASFCLHLSLRCSGTLLTKGNSTFFKAFIKTLPRLPSIIRERRKRMPTLIHSDKEILRKSKSEIRHKA